MACKANIVWDFKNDVANHPVIARSTSLSLSTGSVTKQSLHLRGVEIASLSLAMTNYILLIGLRITKY